MNIRNLTKDEILSQIVYLEKNISNGSATHQRISRLRSLRAILRKAS